MQRKYHFTVFLYKLKHKLSPLSNLVKQYSELVLLALFILICFTLVLLFRKQPTIIHAGGRTLPQTHAEVPRIKETKLKVSLAVRKEVAVKTPVNGDCKGWIKAAGVTDIENAYALIMRESGCNPNATNPTTGACGIPQANPCSKLGTSDPVAQIKWMDNYCRERYGSWAAANSFQLANGWY